MKISSVSFSASSSVSGAPPRNSIAAAAGTAPAASSSDRVNYVNIGLMLVACAIALVIPFELFLFSYAVLGPAHYLTEISWLEKRRFFSPGARDWWLLAALAALVFLSAAPTDRTFTFAMAFFTTAAFGSAIVFARWVDAGPRMAGLAAVFLGAFLLLSAWGTAAMLIGVFVPTLIHVYVFTGIFMLYGALKERSKTGYVAFAVFLACPLVCWLAPHPLLDGLKLRLDPYVVVSYWKSFSPLNLTILGIDPPTNRADAGAAGVAVFESAAGVIAMRFIAFAYTYHYLNWFSKTSIIKWHEAGTPRLAAIAVLWAASVALYVYDYALSVRVLLVLSLMHVYLEFPLNRISILGTLRELRAPAAR